MSIDNSSHITYTSALNSYLMSCKIHKFNIMPTEQTLCFFTVYMSSHIKPALVNSYLSGICNQLELFFPDVRKASNSMLISRTMTGCQRCYGTPVKWKCPLSTSDLQTVISAIGFLTCHDDKLILSMLETGFHGFMCLREISFPDNVAWCNYQKVILQHTVAIPPNSPSLPLFTPPCPLHHLFPPPFTLSTTPPPSFNIKCSKICLCSLIQYILTLPTC